ncbi:MAG TPA: DUF4253 domain-containing protein, partial [Nitrospirota bacterium]|nr:DUF4253 domain-containing protein [Nitrospirota bacterium]
VLLTGMGAKQEASRREARFSSHEEALCAQTGFERDVLLLVKDLVPGHIHRLSGYDPNGYQIVVNGITFSVPEQDAGRVLGILRKRLQPRKYLAFLIAVNEGIRTEEIGILKGTDPYDILRVMQTNGEEYEITTEDIIERLKEWEKRHPFEIIGAENGWVEIEFRTVPQDLEAFAEEVFEFSPDTVEQDAGSVEELAREIARTKRLTLWWDR